MKVVLDTNIWISGILKPTSLAGEVLAHWEVGKLNIVVSEPILLEIERVLNYTKIQKKINWSEENIKQFVDYIQFFTDETKLENVSVDVKKDFSDSFILQTLISSNAGFLIIGDADFNEYKKSYPIVKLADFYNEFMIEL